MSHGVSLAISIAIAYLITTALHITVGEQVPKIYSIVHAERTALRVARPLELFRVAFSPLIWLLNTASNWLLRAGRRGPARPSSRRSARPTTSSC